MPSSAKFSCGRPVVSGVVETGLGAENIPPAARISRRGSSRDVAPQAGDVPARRRGGVCRDPRRVRGLGPSLRGGYCAQQELSAPGASLQLRALEQGFAVCKLTAEGTWAVPGCFAGLADSSRNAAGVTGASAGFCCCFRPSGCVLERWPRPCCARLRAYMASSGRGRAGDACFAGFRRGKVWVAFSSRVGFR